MIWLQIIRQLGNRAGNVWRGNQEGIYSHISFYFPAWFRLDDWHRQNERWPFMLLFFDGDMQKVYFNWARVLLTTPSPYTNLPLGQDPAVAIVEVQNEDSHFFYTFNKKNAPPKRWETLRGLYGQWLKNKYGSMTNARAAWKTDLREGDDPANGKMELLNAWHMTTAGLKSNAADINNNGEISVSELREYVIENVQDLTGGRQKPTTRQENVEFDFRVW